MVKRRASFTNIRGKKEEFSSENLITEDRHYGREAKSQKSQLDSNLKHGTRKDVKIPMKDKLT